MKKVIWSMLVVALVICGITTRTQAQNTSADSSHPRRDETYRLDFSINELEDGKKINVRHYSTNITGGSHELKIGSRVPIESESGKFVYLDIGTSIATKVYGSPEAPILDVTAEISNLAVPDQNTHGGQPTIRQMIISGNTLIVFDKPMIIAAVADPNSKREFQLEVLVTKLR